MRARHTGGSATLSSGQDDAGEYQGGAARQRVDEILEREITKVRGKNGMGYFQARDLVYATYPDLVRTYKDVTLGVLPSWK